MDFIKKHYEKILLSVVLLGLVGALVFLPFIILNDQQQVREMGEAPFRGKVVALTNLDLTEQSNVIERLQSPYRLDFDTTNKLFNPVEWQRTMDSRLIKAAGATPQAAVVTGITPLYLVLTLDSMETNELGARYIIGVERQAAMNPAQRHKQQRYSSVGEKKDVFTITDVKGPPENPDGLVLKLADTGETVTLRKGTPYKRVDAYEADLRYDPEKDIWPGQRAGNHLHFAGDDYTIVDITSNEVVLSAQTNQRKWTLRYAP
jgi:hypothetical protein